ncbi:mucin-22-like [Episyrphus balteatus]|uniref:mucin-22-like n=1 Tax=Episyrphus balteatus TaxID=286459 RepID=UPI0024868A18|nr:mucin-22-like [Episyrphus balteatus]
MNIPTDSGERSTTLSPLEKPNITGIQTEENSNIGSDNDIITEGFQYKSEKTTKSSSIFETTEETFVTFSSTNTTTEGNVGEIENEESTTESSALEGPFTSRTPGDNNTTRVTTEATFTTTHPSTINTPEESVGEGENEETTTESSALEEPFTSTTPSDNNTTRVTNEGENEETTTESSALEEHFTSTTPGHNNTTRVTTEATFTTTHSSTINTTEESVGEGENEETTTESSALEEPFTSTTPGDNNTTHVTTEETFTTTHPSTINTTEGSVGDGIKAESTTESSALEEPFTSTISGDNNTTRVTTEATFTTTHSSTINTTEESVGEGENEETKTESSALEEPFTSTTIGDNNTIRVTTEGENEETTTESSALEEHFTSTTPGDSNTSRVTTEATFTTTHSSTINTTEESVGEGENAENTNESSALEEPFMSTTPGDNNTTHVTTEATFTTTHPSTINKTEGRVSEGENAETTTASSALEEPFTSTTSGDNNTTRVTTEATFTTTHPPTINTTEESVGEGENEETTTHPSTINKTEGRVSEGENAETTTASSALEEPFTSTTPGDNNLTPVTTEESFTTTHPSVINTTEGSVGDGENGETTTESSALEEPFTSTTSGDNNTTRVTTEATFTTTHPPTINTTEESVGEGENEETTTESSALQELFTSTTSGNNNTTLVTTEASFNTKFSYTNNKNEGNVAAGENEGSTTDRSSLKEPFTSTTPGDNNTTLVTTKKTFTKIPAFTSNTTKGSVGEDTKEESTTESSALEEPITSTTPGDNNTTRVTAEVTFTTISPYTTALEDVNENWIEEKTTEISIVEEPQTFTDSDISITTLKPTELLMTTTSSSSKTSIQDGFEKGENVEKISTDKSRPFNFFPFTSSTAKTLPSSFDKNSKEVENESKKPSIQIKTFEGFTVDVSGISKSSKEISATQKFFKSLVKAASSPRKHFEENELAVDETDGIEESESNISDTEEKILSILVPTIMYILFPKLFSSSAISRQPFRPETFTEDHRQGSYVFKGK